MTKDTPGRQEVTAYTLPLSTRLDEETSVAMPETTLVRVEPHGAVVFFRRY